MLILYNEKMIKSLRDCILNILKIFYYRCINSKTIIPLYNAFLIVFEQKSAVKNVTDIELFTDYV